MKHLLTCTFFCILTVFSFTIATTGVHAADFIPLVGIPGIDTQASASLPGYVNALYTAAISIAAFMAVVKIIFAGVKYMLSDLVTSKEAAKKDIRGALIGLLIVLGAVLILNTINPQLKGLTALDGLTTVNVELGSHGCTQTQVDYLTMEELCVAHDGEVCDLDNAGIFCGCGQTVSYTMTEPGFRCDDSEVPPDENLCPFPSQGNCPCGDEPEGGECIPSTILPAISTSISFKEETIDTTTIYTVDEPALPSYEIPAGEYHNQQGTIIGVESGGSINFNGEETSETITFLIFRLTDGTVIRGMGCGLFTPTVPGCS